MRKLNKYDKEYRVVILTRNSTYRSIINENKLPNKMAKNNTETSTSEHQSLPFPYIRDLIDFHFNRFMIGFSREY